MMKKRGRGGRGGLSGTEEAALAARRAGMLDAYTEESNTTMSDSDKFKEGYKKKGKKSEKARKSESEDTAPVTATAEEPTESWDNEGEEEIVDSWEDIEAPEMPVPTKVKQTQRKQEKMRKKEEEQQRKMKEEAAKNQKLQETRSEAVESVAQKMENVSLQEPKPSSNNVPKPSPDAVKADREAKKAAKAAAKAAAKNKKAPEAAPAAKDAAGKSETAPKEQLAAKVEAAVDRGEAADASSLTEEERKKIEKAKRKAEFEAKRAAETGKGKEEKAEGQEKSKAELKAERRAKQEAQRAAKSQAQEQKKSAPKQAEKDKGEQEKVEKKITKSSPNQTSSSKAKSEKLAPLFSHLHQFERETPVMRDLPVSQTNIHPSFVRLGLQMIEGGILGCEQKCVALLSAMQDVAISCITEIKNLSQVELVKELENGLKPNLLFLKQCRPLSLSMGNCVRVIKSRLKTLDSMKSEPVDSVLEEVRSVFSNFVNENLNLAAKQISLTAGNKIQNGDVILTYSGNDLIQHILLDAAKDKKFKVIVADGRLQLRGSEMAARLAQEGVDTTYILISAVTQVLSTVDKVFLGCEAVMANGGVLAQVGTSQVALLAESVGIPVLMCCQSFKFTERVQTDSFVYNELLDPAEVAHNQAGSNHAEKWKDQSSLHLLNLAYDVTPASLVSGVITEISVVPTTSVPVILRLKKSECEAY